MLDGLAAVCSRISQAVLHANSGRAAICSPPLSPMSTGRRRNLPTIKKLLKMQRRFKSELGFADVFLLFYSMHILTFCYCTYVYKCARNIYRIGKKIIQLLAIRMNVYCTSKANAPKSFVCSCGTVKTGIS